MKFAVFLTLVVGADFDSNLHTCLLPDRAGTRAVHRRMP